MAIVAESDETRLRELCRGLSSAGVNRIRLRFDVRQSGRNLLGLVRGGRAAASPSGGEIVVSERVDVALLAECRHVHLKERGLPLREVRRAFPDLVIGVSRHTIEGVKEAESLGADSILYGPIFQSPGKESRALGLESLEAAVRSVSVPVWAVGGVTEENAFACIRTGAFGVAAIRPFQNIPSAEARARAFVEALS